MYSNHVGSRAIALYPDKSKVNDLIRKLKKIFQKSSNLDAYNLIAKLNSCLRGWGSYFNLGNCARYRSLIKNLVYKMCWEWANRKHKTWGKNKIAEFYFLIKQKNKNKKTSESKNSKHVKWSFYGAVNSKSFKKSNILYLYNIVERGTTVSALIYSVPQHLRKIHACHSDLLKFIEWSVKANQKATRPFLSRKSNLYKKQKGFCSICKTSFTEQKFSNNKMHIQHIIPIFKGGRVDLEGNMVLVHSLCHKSIDH